MPLADEALHYNADLRVAAARVEIAAAALKAAGGAPGAGGRPGRPDRRQGDRRARASFPGCSSRPRGSSICGAGCATAAPPPMPSSHRRRPTSARPQQAIVATLAKAWFIAAEAELQRRVVDDMLGGAETLRQPFRRPPARRRRQRARRDAGARQPAGLSRQRPADRLRAGAVAARARGAARPLSGGRDRAAGEPAARWRRRRRPACRRSCSSVGPTSSRPSGASPPRSTASARRARIACRGSR